MPFRLPSGTKAALDRIAEVSKQEVQEILRQAAYAIIRYADANGPENLPRDMEITQRQMEDVRLARRLDRDTEPT